MIDTGPISAILVHESIDISFRVISIYSGKFFLLVRWFIEPVLDYETIGIAIVCR